MPIYGHTTVKKNHCKAYRIKKRFPGKLGKRFVICKDFVYNTLMKLLKCFLSFMILKRFNIEFAGLNIRILILSLFVISQAPKGLGLSTFLGLFLGAIALNLALLTGLTYILAIEVTPKAMAYLFRIKQDIHCVLVELDSFLSSYFFFPKVFSTSFPQLYKLFEYRKLKQHVSYSSIPYQIYPLSCTLIE